MPRPNLSNSRRAGQWVGEEKRLLSAGDSVYIPNGTLHGTYNGGEGELDFLAILTPARISGPVSVEMADQDPWLSLRG